MFAQLFDSFRKASEASLLAQQDIFKQWVRQWPSASLNDANSSAESTEAVQKRWIEATTEALNKHRELLDANYRTGIQVIDQGFRVGEARSPEDYRRVVEELWRKLSDTFKSQSEAQFREFQKATERWMSLAQSSSHQNGSDSERRYTPDSSNARS